MRILIATHAPALETYGAGQMALNLAAALRSRGHTVDTWTPPIQHAGVRWWRTHHVMRRALAEYVETTATYDVIDAPPFLIGRFRKAPVLLVARSVQPDLRYLWSELRDFLLAALSSWEPRSWAEAAVRALYAFYVFLLVLRGWRRADRILCLGSLETAWMRSRFPWKRSVLRTYLSALSDTDSERLAHVREGRMPRETDATRMLWVGRWVAHKGTKRLVNFIDEWTAIRPQDEFTVAGTGYSQDPGLARLRMHARVTIRERFDRGELTALLSSHDIGLFTSDVEGWGLVINEMLEAGMPVYATRAGAVPDVQPHTDRLFSFPPKPGERLYSLDRGLTESYRAAFNWNAIAREYERSVVGDCATARGDLP